MNLSNDLTAMPRRILVADGKSLDTILGDLDNVVETLNGSDVFPDEPAVYAFSVFDTAITIGHDQLHYHFTPDGRWARVDMFDQPLPPPRGRVRLLPPP